MRNRLPASGCRHCRTLEYKRPRRKRFSRTLFQECEFVPGDRFRDMGHCRLIIMGKISKDEIERHFACLASRVARRLNSAHGATNAAASQVVRYRGHETVSKDGGGVPKYDR